MKLLLYCTKAKPYLYMHRGYQLTNDENIKNECGIFNGKIVAECDFEVEGIDYNFYDYADWFYSTKGTWSDELYRKACMQEEKMEKYLVPELLMCSQDNVGYAIHIKDLHIFDKPKNLSETYENVCDKCKMKHYPSCLNCIYNYCGSSVNLTSAPQNMRYCYYKGNKYVLVSINPEWLCKILNGEKTIEVRKKVLKEMLK